MLLKAPSAWSAKWPDDLFCYYTRPWHPTALPGGVERADYGYDRPDFAKYLPIGAGLIVGATVLSGASLLTGWAANLALTLGWMFGLLFLGFGMVFLLSKRGKLRQRDVLLGAIPWRGDERVLDVGCGPGLLLVGAAKRLTTGSAVGIDIWDTSVESGNFPETALRNAEVEGVAGRVEVKYGDARKLDFGDGSFDVVLARAVLHHIKDEGERNGAVRAMIRVLRPGGHLGLVLVDFNRLGRYIEVMEGEGMNDVRVLSRAFGQVVLVAKRA